MLLLLLGMGLTATLAPACLVPPDFEFATAENMQTHVDRTAIQPLETLLTVDCTLPEPIEPTEPTQAVSTVIEFDIRSAIVNPDDDELFVTWYVNYSEADGGQFAQTDTEVFRFDPCSDPKTKDDSINLIEVVVMDRRPKSLASAAESREVVDPETTQDIVRWYIVVEGL